MFLNIPPPIKNFLIEILTEGAMQVALKKYLKLNVEMCQKYEQFLKDFVYQDFERKNKIEYIFQKFLLMSETRLRP